MKNLSIKRLLVFVLIAILFTAPFSPNIAFASETQTQTGDLFDNFDVTVDGRNVNVGNTNPSETGWAGIIGKYKDFIVGIAAIGAVTMVLAFIVQFMRLAQTAGNTKARSEALSGILWTGVAAAGLGAVALITSLFYGAIK